MSEALKKIIFEMGDADVIAEYKKVNAHIDARFFDPELLKHIHAELDKKHKLDHREKMAIFIVAATGYLRDARDHCSCALKGNSSAGKDNVIDTVLDHYPADDWIKVTRATTATLEDDIINKKIVAFSEINKNREFGANAEIVEAFKQLAEGGTSTLKKDAKTGFKTAIRTEQKQKTLLYGTTETESDEELETRYVITPVKGYREKNRVVVVDVLKKAKDEDYYLEKNNQEDSWIAVSISLLDPEVQAIIPFSEMLGEKIDGKEIFDTRKDRVKRDVKRILSLTRAIAWLHQLQRKRKSRDNMTFVYAEPSDFLNALRIFADFINLTYSGVDHRLLGLLEYAEKHRGYFVEEIKNLGFQERYHDWILRHEAQKALKIGTVNTIKNWINKLKNLNKVDTHYDRYVSQKTFLFRPINQPANNLALPVNINDIDGLLQVWLQSDSAKEVYEDHKITPYLLEFEEYGTEDEEEAGTSSHENDMSGVTREKLVVEEEYIQDNQEESQPTKFDYQKVLTVKKEDEQ